VNWREKNANLVLSYASSTDLQKTPSLHEALMNCNFNKLISNARKRTRYLGNLLIRKLKDNSNCSFSGKLKHSWVEELEIEVSSVCNLWPSS